ncbi:hypothetical protein GOBAR_AA01631 [Gossypium barbadense]|uniref:Terpene synthase N-terminal domain-containing protein n=1 Tax=Gossypium barbadense TaxID=3634 RepID=A0A2P5YTX5_GOSBA|nr:hypothetical protein GOBAR_AA01631 [Gossypium barbadense]
MSKENRHLADFNLSFSKDIFLSSLVEMNINAKAHLQYEELKQQVRRMLVTSVAYHFKKEIEDALHIIYHHHCNNMFNKFIDEKGKFKESLIIDMKGMLELYEVVHFQLHGETILEEALAFTMFHLKSTETTMDYPLSTQIANALKRPLHKSLPRLVAWSYIPIYEGYGTLAKNLKIFAQLDFIMVQHLHKELSKINRWWKGLDVATSFPFIRDGLIYLKPHYTIARTFMTKVISLTSILDDIYNASNKEFFSILI